MTLDAYFFWRESTADGLFGVPYVLVWESSGNLARHIGNQYNLELNWQATPFTGPGAILYVSYRRAIPVRIRDGKQLTFIAPRVTLKC